MSDIFLDLFSDLLSIVFSLNCGYLFCLTFITMKITMKEQREKRERKTKISYSINKTFGKKKMVRGHSFMTFAKKCKIRRLPLLLCPQTYNFGLRSLHSCVHFFLCSCTQYSLFSNVHSVFPLQNCKSTIKECSGCKQCNRSQTTARMLENLVYD